MKSKGLSQVLSVIVAASVLMMLGLTLTIMTQASLTDLFSDSQRDGCIQTISSQCAVQDEIPTPSSCTGEDIDDSVDELAKAAGAESGGPDRITCDR